MISVMFWGFTVVSLIIAWIAIHSGNWRFMIASAILYSQFALYLQATPRFAGTIWLFLFHFLIGYIIYTKTYRLDWLAWMSLLPLTAFPIWIAYMVLNP